MPVAGPSSSAPASAGRLSEGPVSLGLHGGLAASHHKFVRVRATLNGSAASASPPDGGVDRTLLVDPLCEVDLKACEENLDALLDTRLAEWRSRCLPVVALVLRESPALAESGEEAESVAVPSCAGCASLIDLSAAASALTPRAEKDISVFFYEFVYAVTWGLLPPLAASQFLRDVALPKARMHILKILDDIHQAALRRGGRGGGEDVPSPSRERKRLSAVETSEGAGLAAPGSEAESESVVSSEKDSSATGADLEKTASSGTARETQGFNLHSGREGELPCLTLADCCVDGSLDLEKTQLFLNHVLGLGASATGPRSEKTAGASPNALWSLVSSCVPGRLASQLPSPFLGMLLDAFTVCADMLSGVQVRPLARRARANVSAFLRQMESLRLVLPIEVAAFVSSARLDELQWQQTGLSGQSQNGPSRRRVNDLLVKERTKRKFTLSVHNAAREHIAAYSKLYVAFLEVGLRQDALPGELCANLLRTAVSRGNLCPSRSLSLLLGAIEECLWSRNQLLPLLRLFSREKLKEVLGFTLNMYADARRQRDRRESLELSSIKLPSSGGQPSSGAGTSSGMQTGGQRASANGGSLAFFRNAVSNCLAAGPSESFYEMLAVLVMRGFVSLSELYPYLHPPDALLCVLFDRLASRYSQALTQAKSGSVPLPPKPQTSLRQMLALVATPSGEGSHPSSRGGGFSPSAGVLAGAGNFASTQRGPSSSAGGVGFCPPFAHPYSSSFPANGAPPPMGNGFSASHFYGGGGFGSGLGLSVAREEGALRHQAMAEASAVAEAERREREAQMVNSQKQLRAVEDAHPLADMPGAREFLLEDDQGYRAARDHVYRQRIGKFDLLSALLDLNAFEEAEQLLVHFAFKLKVLPTLNERIQRSLVRFIMWLLHPIIKGPEGSLREMLKTRTKSSPEKTGAESWKERAREGLEPSEEELASLREKAADLSQSLAEFPRHWMGLVLPSQRNVEGGAFTFRPQGLRQCHSFEDFLDRILPLLKILHASLAYEPRLFAAVLGVLKEGMAETPSSEEKRRRRHRLLDDLIAETIFPALSQCLHGATLMNALLWEVLEKMPSQRRYRLYDRVAQSWREGAAPLALNYEVARVKLRKLLKRLTSGIFEKNARSQDRTILAEIATLSLTAPLPLCEAVMAQADLFDDNMVHTLSEATRRVSAVAADVFVSRFIQRQLARKDSGVEKDGTTVSKKLLNRAVMAARFLKAHCETDLRPLLLSTVMRLWRELHTREGRRLQGGSAGTSDSESMAVDEDAKPNSVSSRQGLRGRGGLSLQICGRNSNYPNDLMGFVRDKEYIEKIVEFMGACPKLPEAGALTADQIYAQAGGPLLKAEVMLSGSEEDAVSAGDSKAQKALLQVLRDKRLLTPLLLLPAKIRCEVLYDSEFRRPLQQFASLIDGLHTYQLQLVEYFSRAFPVTSALNAAEEYKALLPSFDEIFRFYPPALAWMILRPALPDFIRGNFAASLSNSAAGNSSQREGLSAEATKTEEVARESESSSAPSPEGAALSDEWKGVMQPLLLSYVQPEQLYTLSLEFVLLFWRLSLSDILVPNEQYEASLAKLSASLDEMQRALDDIERGQKGLQSSVSSFVVPAVTAAMTAVGVSDFSRKEEEALRKRRNKIKTQRRLLAAEWEALQTRCSIVKAALALHSKNWLLPHPPAFAASAVSSAAGTVGAAALQLASGLHAKTETSSSQAEPMAVDEATVSAAESVASNSAAVSRRVSLDSADGGSVSESGGAAPPASVGGGGEEKSSAVRASASLGRGPFSIRAFVKLLLIPRVLNSEADALFCAYFVTLLLDLKTPLFNFLDFMNIWTRMMVPLIRSSTEREAQLLGLFVNEVLRPVRRWLADKEAFDAETRGNCCFALAYKFTGSNQVQHSQLVSGARKWESRIFDGLVQSLPLAAAASESPNLSAWLETKAAVVFLSRCHSTFPLTHKRGAELIHRLTDAIAVAQPTVQTPVKDAPPPVAVERKASQIEAPKQSLPAKEPVSAEPRQVTPSLLQNSPKAKNALAAVAVAPPSEVPPAKRAKLETPTAPASGVSAAVPSPNSEVRRNVLAPEAVSLLRARMAAAYGSVGQRKSEASNASADDTADEPGAIDMSSSGSAQTTPAAEPSPPAKPPVPPVLSSLAARGGASSSARHSREEAEAKTLPAKTDAPSATSKAEHAALPPSAAASSGSQDAPSAIGRRVISALRGDGSRPSEIEPKSVFGARPSKAESAGEGLSSGVRGGSSASGESLQSAETSRPRREGKGGGGESVSASRVAKSGTRENAAAGQRETNFSSSKRDSGGMALSALRRPPSVSAEGGHSHSSSSAGGAAASASSQGGAGNSSFSSSSRVASSGSSSQAASTKTSSASNEGQSASGSATQRGGVPSASSDSTSTGEAPRAKERSARVSAIRSAMLAGRNLPKAPPLLAGSRLATAQTSSSSSSQSSAPTSRALQKEASSASASSVSSAKASASSPSAAGPSSAGKEKEKEREREKEREEGEVRQRSSHPQNKRESEGKGEEERKRQKAEALGGSRSTAGKFVHQNSSGNEPLPQPRNALFAQQPDPRLSRS